jgi:hypothetical protein
VFLLRHLSDSVQALQRQLADIDAHPMAGMKPYAWAHGASRSKGTTEPAGARLGCCMLRLSNG